MKLVLSSQPKPKLWVDESGIPPPSTVTVDLERKAVLYLPDGKVLVRQVGFK